jgi:virginiamycin A acetyltransferase
MRRAVKSIIQGVTLLIAAPFAALAGFGRFARMFEVFGQLISQVPGLPGDYLRVSYYFLTLRRSSLHSRVSFGSFFAQSPTTVGKGVYIGCYCVLGVCEIGDRTQIASHVQVLSGRHQHTRLPDGRISGADEKTFQPVSIGADCWIGASAIIMADIGSGSTIGAGAVVTRPVPASSVAVGNPARLIERIAQ